MGNRPKRNRTRTPVIDVNRFGVSFSVKQCRDFNITHIDALTFLLKKMGLRRFRLMSYWDECEKKPGDYDFTELDVQIKLIAAYKGKISLCLGARQPRWPESHWPKWALSLPQEERYQALCDFIEAVVQRYKKQAAIISWQLENEALNRSFGTNGDFNRARLRHELALVRTLDANRPIIMSTSNTWGIPLRRPRPDNFGFTFYRVQYEDNAYRRSKVPWQWPVVRSHLIRLITKRHSFIHELQAEPWGPKAIWEMSAEEQAKSMSIEQLKTNIELAKKTKLYPIDLWGGEWWYWRSQQGDDALWHTVQKALREE